jgi:hypothetical protein
MVSPWVVTDTKLSILAETKRCKFFNGIQHDFCRANVEYRKHFGDQPGWAKHIPCLSDPDASITCDKAAYPTQAEATETVRRQDEMLNRVLNIIPKIKVHAKAKGIKRGHGGIGEMPCPSNCGGTVRYSVASVNGHMHAICSTPNCVSFME